MPVTPTYPGVYIEELPSGVRTIMGVSTSVTAFVGYTRRGPTDKPVQLFNFGDFERQFGGLDVDSDVSYAVQQYFQNGGAEAWVVRVANGAARAGITLLEASSTTAVLEVKASSEGVWGNNLRLDVDYDTANPASLFNLTVTELAERGGTVQAVQTETHRNLSMNSYDPNYAVDAINGGSNLVRVERPAGAVTALAAADGTSESGDLSAFDFTKLDDDHRRLAITVNGDGPYEFDLFGAGGSISGTTQNDKIDDLADKIEDAVQLLKPADPAFSSLACSRSGSKIVATSGDSGERSSVRFSNASMRNAAQLLGLGIANGGREADAAAQIRPAQTGTVGASLSGLDLTTLAATAAADVTITSGTTTVGPVTLGLWTTQPTSLEEVRANLDAALAAASQPELAKATVTLVDGRLRVVAGTGDPNVRLTFAEATGDTTATDIGLVAAAGAVPNVTQNALGIGETVQAQSSAIPGSDGNLPTLTDLKGSLDSKKGMYALEDVDIFNILCLPNVSDSTVLSEAVDYCDERRAFLLIDLPSGVDTLDEAKQWLGTNATLRHKNAAAYFPRPKLPDSQRQYRLRPFPACGVIAGLYARTDSERGVWKAPAGIDAALRGVRGLTYKLTDKENGVLNPLGLNCLRNFPVYGNVAWGARTLVGADALTSEWKYIPVRRLALYMEESLYRGTQWVVFEPNDEPLWAQIRLNVGAFMHNLFRQGAFAGQTPREAYFVKCDSETTTQDDVNRGIVNILVGFAPLKPAEFVVIKISQIAGQDQA